MAKRYPQLRLSFALLSILLAGVAVFPSEALADQCSRLFFEVQQKTSARPADTIYLDSASSNVPALLAFERYFAETKASASYEDVYHQIEVLAQDERMPAFLERYKNDAWKFLKIKDFFSWFNANSDVYRAIKDYIDPQDDDAPSWQSVNQKLRRGGSLTTRDRKFIDDLLFAMDRLPSYHGLAWRGSMLRPSVFSEYKEGAVVKDPAFVSTSLSPETAMNFSGVVHQGSTRGRISVMYMIKVKLGAPITAVFNDNQQEKEILLRPGQSFIVRRNIQNAARTKAIVVLEQI